MGLADLGRLEGWEVPWGGGVVAGGMAAWVSAFAVTGLVLTPLLATELGLLDPGVPASGLSPARGPYLLLLNQLLTTGLSLGALLAVVRWATRERGEEEDAPGRVDLLLLDPGAPAWRLEDGWLTWALIGCAATPVAVGLTAGAVGALGLQDSAASGTADVVVSTLSLDPRADAALFAVTSVLAPGMEEVVFRGFLLASLTKWLEPVPAVLVSAGFFGCAHLSARDLPELVAVGTVLGVVYLRSKNLLTPIIVHSFWNSGVLFLLLALTAGGYDVEKLLHPV